MEFPNNLKYTNDHEWIRVENGTGWIGITEYAQSELGDIVYIELPSVGSGVEENKSFGTVEAVKAVSDLLAPVSGEVKEINANLKDHPEIVNKDPYGEGWMIKISVANADQLKPLMDAQAYKSFIGK